MSAVISDRLYWAPQTDGDLPPAMNGEGCVSVSALLLCTEHPGEANAEAMYFVPHYAPEASGRAFGPLALDQVIWFCHNLEQKLKEHKKVVLYTRPECEQGRTNAAVMLGAYLVLRHSWSAEQVAEALGADEAARRFICSFATRNRPEPVRNMRVMDCWEGMVLARDFKWMDVNVCVDRRVALRAIKRHRAMADTYDAAWLIPGRVLVAADPTTTAVDPNPETFKSVFPSAVEVVDASFVSESTLTPSSSAMFGNSDYETPRAAWTEESLERAGSAFSGASTAASSIAAESLQKKEKKQAVIGAGTSFVDFLQDCGVSTVIRTNSLQEQGMLSRSYDGKRMGAFGIEHTDITLEDGGVPSRADVAEALQATARAMESKDEAILVHCKGGFGRSVIVACCVIIEHLNIPGPALLGWVRMARPGAINTTRQERFLQSLRSRTDLRRFMQAGGQVTCGPGQCSMM